MVAPSKSFTVIPDGDVDPDSPLSTNLMTELRNNDIHLEEWLGDGFVAAKDHDHDGVNSKKVDFNNLLNITDTAKSATFNLNLTVSGASTSGTVDTGAIGFTPKAVIVVGDVNNSGINKRTYTGVASGTGANQGGHENSVITAIAGSYQTALIQPQIAINVDLEVTTFASSGIIFTGSKGGGEPNTTWNFTVLVIGAAT